MLPAVGTIVTERGRIGESERKTERLTASRRAADDRRQIEHDVDQARKKLASLKKTLGEDEAKQRTSTRGSANSRACSKRRSRSRTRRPR